ncbi:hypothetical protein KUTeg_014974 [Tegillarca granosa]|uniref:Uncharacterized protein n=1 Tax=Tegillarca granosa TaxID=220873 RepID=A0ABQ9ENZ4_TEGGR|nr:hypothetical protein KUTeg_014974 [Tegillarca granosa]
MARGTCNILGTEMCGLVKSRFCLLCYLVSCVIHSSFGGPTTKETTVSTTTKYDGIKNSSNIKFTHVHKHYHELNTLEINNTSEQPGEREECVEADELFKIYHYKQSGITQEQFIHLCPAILIQLDRNICSSNFHSEHADVSASYLKDIPLEVWGYSFASVLVISLVGLFGVAVIPIMQKVFYNHLLQFLVALAVGALSGDAMLHLIPHALQDSHVSHDHSSHGDKSHEQSHANGVYKGLCGLAGIYFFFLMERLLTILTDMKRKRKKIDFYIKDRQNYLLYKRNLNWFMKCYNAVMLKRKTRAVVNGNGSGGEKCMEALNTHKDANCREKMMVIHPENGSKNITSDVLPLQARDELSFHSTCIAVKADRKQRVRCTSRAYPP